MSHPKATALRGLMTAILTPLDRQGRLALEHFPTLLEFQRRGGVDGVVVCGTNGEGTSLSVEERKRTLEAALAHRGVLTVVAGTGAASVTDAVELTRHAAQAGADAALVLPPFYFKNPTVEGLAAYFRAVLDAADIPVLLYSIPQQTAVPITDALLELLSGHPNLAGLKDSAGDWARTQELLARYPHLRIFGGHDKLASRGYASGSAGCISGNANAFPEVVAAVRDAHRADPTGAQAEAAQARLSALADITLRYPLIAVSKSVLAHRGLPRLGVRPPLVNLTPAQEESLLAELRAAGFLPKYSQQDLQN
ncbi:MAG TPA: dihydrodipicolinate synthase family protein [Chthonomonadaceae bacterium]|nr:dihydrodipicolinate synthase family protein [Chthonomonadaceae bacterium]